MKSPLGNTLAQRFECILHDVQNRLPKNKREAHRGSEIRNLYEAAKQYAVKLLIRDTTENNQTKNIKGNFQPQSTCKNCLFSS